MLSNKFHFEKRNVVVSQKFPFIDRESARDEFCRFITATDSEIDVLMYYGVGGIGKSTLLAENVKKFREIYPDGVTFSVDFYEVEKRSVDRMLLQFVDDNADKISFDAFNIAYTLYFSKKFAGDDYNRTKESISPKFDLLFKIIGIFDNGAIGAMVEIVEKILQFAKRFALDDYVLDDLNQFASMSIAEIEEHLPAYFEYDLQRYFSANPETHALFSIDTFEALNVEQTEEIHRRRNEEWFQEFMALFLEEAKRNCFFVIYGRDKLSWENEWMKRIQLVELNEFSPHWIASYMANAGITDQSIASCITKNSKGNPFYLYLSAKTYADICLKGRQPTVQDFGRTPKEIIRRFIYNLSDDEVSIFKYLSVLNFFSYEIFTYLLSKFSIACDPERFNHIIGYSFIQTLHNGNYYLLPLMRSGLLDNTNPASVDIVHTYMLNFYKQRFINGSTKDFFELVFHAEHCMNVETFNAWFIENKYIDFLILCQLKANQECIYSVTESIINYYGLANLDIRLINIYIDALHLGGDYHAAVETSNTYLQQFSHQEIVENEPVFNMFIRKIHYSMFFLPVDELMRNVEDIMHDEHLNSFPQQKNEILFLLGGNLGVLSGRFDYAIEILNKALNHALKTNSKHTMMRVVRKLADISTYRGDYCEAIQSIEKYITIDLNPETRYEVYMLGALGEAYRKSGNLSTARECFTSVLKASQQKHIPSWIAHAKLALSMLKFQTKEYSCLIDDLEEVEKDYEQIGHEWGKINTRTLKWMVYIAQHGMSEDCRQELQKISRIAQNMNYRYNLLIIDELLHEQMPYFQLFFL